MSNVQDDSTDDYTGLRIKCLEKHTRGLMERLQFLTDIFILRYIFSIYYIHCNLGLRLKL